MVSAYSLVSVAAITMHKPEESNETRDLAGTSGTIGSREIVS